MDNVREWESVEHSILNRISLLSHFLQGSEINKQKKSIMKSQKMEIEGERENKRQKDEGGDEKKASRLDQLFWFLQTSLHSSDICNCIKSVIPCCLDGETMSEKKKSRKKVPALGDGIWVQGCPQLRVFLSPFGMRGNYPFKITVKYYDLNLSFSHGSKYPTFTKMVIFFLFDISKTKHDKHSVFSCWWGLAHRKKEDKWVSHFCSYYFVFELQIQNGHHFVLYHLSS